MSNKHISITPVAGSIPYDNTTSGLAATDVNAAINELAALGGGGSSPPNFSYRIIAAASILTIPTNQQMLVVGPVEVDGVLNIDGELILME